MSELRNTPAGSARERRALSTLIAVCVCSAACGDSKPGATNTDSADVLDTSDSADAPDTDTDPDTDAVDISESDARTDPDPGDSDAADADEVGETRDVAEDAVDAAEDAHDGEEAELSSLGAVVVALSWEAAGVDPFTEPEFNLHFAHPYAATEDIDGDGDPDPWFHNPYDCFWFNQNPEWASLDPTVDDNPRLDGDRDPGLDVMVVNSLEDGLVYEVGVHYWNERGNGEQPARLRVWVDEVRVYDQTLTLRDLDMWEVGELAWPQRTFEGCEDGCVKREFEHPFFRRE